MSAENGESKKPNTETPGRKSPESQANKKESADQHDPASGAEDGAVKPSAEIVNNLTEIDQRIDAERAALNAARDKLGLPPAVDSVAISALEIEREGLLKELEENRSSVNPAIVHYFLKKIGKEETAQRLDALPATALNQLRKAILAGNIPLIVHIMELSELAELHKERAAHTRNMAGSEQEPEFSRLYNAAREMDSVNKEHDAKVRTIVEELKLYDPRPSSRDEEELTALYRKILK